MSSSLEEEGAGDVQSLYILCICCKFWPRPLRLVRIFFFALRNSIFIYFFCKTSAARRWLVYCISWDHVFCYLKCFRLCNAILRVSYDMGQLVKIKPLSCFEAAGGVLSLVLYSCDATHCSHSDWGFYCMRLEKVNCVAVFSGLCSLQLFCSWSHQAINDSAWMTCPFTYFSPFLATRFALGLTNTDMLTEGCECRIFSTGEEYRSLVSMWSEARKIKIDFPIFISTKILILMKNRIIALC